MRFRIRHASWYRYDLPVALAPHVFRLKPRESAGLRLDTFRLSVYPLPVEMSAWRDAEGNTVTSASFEGDTHELRVVAESEGAISRDGVFVLGDTPGIAVPAVAPVPAGFLSPVLRDFLRAAGEDAGGAQGDPAAFLAALSGRMNASIRHISRPTGLPLEPEETLLAGQGACRDFAALFLAACRHRGIPARFVSGYLPAAPGQRQHMHAWAEALLPDLGWRSFDPTRREGVGPDHIPVAAAADPAAAAPIEGAFTPRGGEARSEMNVDVVVEVSS
ncbi:MAG TPA: transglutaminase family protein [Fibrobacteria bacterium]|jgi:transglutaminase-like putative cysteine protease|nr:transglutaminase family protein [Fibrobacteria bacterium]